jgi:YYY domain-containing protein
MISFLIWFLIISILGWAAAPLAYRILPNLADRGFFFSKVLGLLVISFFFWLLVVLGILRNDAGGILLCFLLVILTSAFSLRQGGIKEWLGWIGDHKKAILAGEILFFIAFALMTILRAANPDIIGTEKPMELAFINSILRSPTFPPHDPWLSGYAISYYYFGYVMSALLIKVSGIPSGVGFNLSIGLWFALTALTAYGVMYSLVNRWHSPEKVRENQEKPNKTRILSPILAPIFILVLSNLEGFLEMLHARGIFWSETGGQFSSKFWEWLNVAELVNPPAVPFSWVPERLSGIWWWRASRVLQDFDLQGNVKEIIDEFPFFSFLLSDLHPHVLSMPFVLLAIGFSLNFYFSFNNKKLPVIGLFSRAAFLFRGKENQEVEEPRPFIATSDFWQAGLIFGGLSFLNTWDFPIYVGLFCVVFILVKIQYEGWKIIYILDFIELGLALGLAGVLLYLPFYFGFSSQAGGLLPSLGFFTRGTYFWLMFGSLLIPIVIWMLQAGKTVGTKKDWLFGIKIAAGIVFGLWLLSYVIGSVMGSLVAWASLTYAAGNTQGLLWPMANRIIDLNNLFTGLQGSSLNSNLLVNSLLKRVVEPGTWLSLLAILAVIFGIYRAIISSSLSENKGELEKNQKPIDWADQKKVLPFVLVLVFVGTGLTLLPEFFYLRDQFGWRMNTIFKFYFQTWILWALAGSYATTMIWKNFKSDIRWIVRAGSLIVILAGLAYPIFGIWTKTNNLRPVDFTLDGNAYMAKYAPGEVEAIEYLKKAPLGVVAEAVGGSYSGFARVSTLSGLPTVLGWPGHESQWRGGSKEIGTRETDIERLYQTSGWLEAYSILQQYKVRYVYVGSLEKSKYRVNENKFIANLSPIFKNNDVVIYEVPSSLE